MNLKEEGCRRVKIFNLSKDVVNLVIREIERAKRFVRLAVFQIHNEDLFTTLDDLLKQGIRVDIFTLPYDSINENIREDVVNHFESIRDNGANLFFCRWNVGDPERTSTAVGRWYSYHGKFIVTDKSAISLSANFSQDPELDAALIYRDDIEKVNEYNEIFDELQNRFITEYDGYEGTLRRYIVESGITDPESLFQLPTVIESETHVKHWIRHYPSSMCPSSTNLEDRIYIIPFDCRGRDLLMSLINESFEYVYISTESFTDPDFPEFLKQTKLRGLDIKVLTEAGSMDFTDRLQTMLRDLLAADIKVKTNNEGIHAKLLITDRYVAVGSINLNRMNLGFSVTNNYWRENTETISICSDTDIIKTAKDQYISIFNRSTDIETVLSAKLERMISKMFTKTFKLKTRTEVKKLFAKLIINEEIRVKKLVFNIGIITSKLMLRFNKQMVEKHVFLMAAILFYLSERKHDANSIKDKLSVLDPSIDHLELFDNLMDEGLIEKDDDYYKIKVSKLF